MKGKEVTLFGATGLIGSSLLEILLKDDRYSKINVVTRRPFLVNNIKFNILPRFRKNLNRFNGVEQAIEEWHS